jgi:ABC-type transport system involved in cytochrome c biogenesis permease subunit
MKPLLLAAAGAYMFGSSRRPLFVAAVVAELVYVGMRGAALGRLPLTGPHDTVAFFSASIGVMALPVVFAGPARDSSAFRWGAGWLAGLVALVALLFPVFSMPLPPILNTLWFEAHVGLAFFAYALFGLGAVAGAIYLLSASRRDFLDLQYRLCLVGYSFFSLSMVTGGIWGYYAWGTYWLWTPKELWTSVLWLFYTIWLHVRLKGWEKGLAWGGIAGFAVTLFTYLGVSMLLKSSHSF